MSQTRRANVPADLEPGVQHRALLFDWDGTLADSHRANHRAFAEVVRRLGVELSWEWFSARTGTSFPDALAELLGDRVPEDIEPLVAARDAAYLRQLDLVHEHPAVAGLLRREHGRRHTAIASGGHIATLRPTAEALGLAPLVEQIVTLDDVDAGKPAPDLFLRAAGLLGVRPGECLVYEDSDEGLEAARRAGMDAVDVRAVTS